MKIKPNTLVKKWGWFCPNTPRKCRKSQLLTAWSFFFMNESRVKRKGGDAQHETTDVRSAPSYGLDTTKALQKCPEKGGLAQSRVGTSSRCGHPINGHLPHEGMSNSRPCIHKVIFDPPNHSLLFGEVQRGHLSGAGAHADTTVWDRHGKEKSGPFRPLLQGKWGMGIDYLQIYWL